MSLALWLVAALAAPIEMPVTAVMRDADGALVPDGDVEVRLSLYANDGSPLWEETSTVRVRRGRFHARLGSGSPLDSELFADRSAVTLGVGLPGEADLGLVSLSTAPWAGHAVHVRDATTVGGRDLDTLAAEAITEAEVRDLVVANTLTPSTDLYALLDPIYRPFGWQADWTDVVDMPASVADGDQGITNGAQMAGWFDGDFDTTPDTIPDDGRVTPNEVDSNLSIDNGLLTSVSGAGSITVGGSLALGAYVIDKHQVEAGPGQVGQVQVISPSAVERLCTRPDGCRIVLAMSNYGGAAGEVASRTGRLYADGTTGRWSVLDQALGLDGDAVPTEWGAWDCYLTDAETVTGTNGRADDAGGLSLGLINLAGGTYPDGTTVCRLFLERVP